MSFKTPIEVRYGRQHNRYETLLRTKFNHLDYNQMVMDLADAKWDDLFKFGAMAPRASALAYLLGSGVNFDDYLAQHVAGSGFVGADHYDHAYQG